MDHSNSHKTFFFGTAEGLTQNQENLIAVAPGGAPPAASVGSSAGKNGKRRGEKTSLWSLDRSLFRRVHRNSHELISDRSLTAGHVGAGSFRVLVLGPAGVQTGSLPLGHGGVRARCRHISVLVRVFRWLVWFGRRRLLFLTTWRSELWLIEILVDYEGGGLVPGGFDFGAAEGPVEGESALQFGLQLGHVLRVAVGHAQFLLDVLESEEGLVEAVEDGVGRLHDGLDFFPELEVPGLEAFQHDELRAVRFPAETGNVRSTRRCLGVQLKGIRHEVYSTELFHLNQQREHKISN